MSQEIAVDVGSKAPEFCLPNQSEEEVCLSQYRGKWVVLYFYPRDNTSGCTREAQDFSSYVRDFEKLGAVILGVSPDSVKSHQNFIVKKDLRITLLSDQSHEVMEAYGVWQLKRMYGKEHMGVVRSTFLIDPEGKIAAVWRKVKVRVHVEEVLSRLKELNPAGAVELVKEKDLEWVEVVPGISRKTLAYGDKVMVVETKLEKGTEIPEHKHTNEQVTYLLSGMLKLIVAGKEFVMEPGDSIVVPGNVLHTGTALEETIVLDSFSPPREDYK
jgi:peroxiredoxin Q/BCP